MLTKKNIKSRGENLWRYKELLPIDGEPQVGPRVRVYTSDKADNLAKELGVSELYVKDDTVAHPTLSFKDRVVAVALTKAKRVRV